MVLFPVPFLTLVHSAHIYLPMKMEQTECSETSAYKIQTPGNYPKESIQAKLHLLIAAPTRFYALGVILMQTTNDLPVPQWI